MIDTRIDTRIDAQIERPDDRYWHLNLDTALSSAFILSTPQESTFTLSKVDFSGTVKITAEKIPDRHYIPIAHLCLTLWALQRCLRSKISPDPANYTDPKNILFVEVQKNRQSLVYISQVSLFL